MRCGSGVCVFLGLEMRLSARRGASRTCRPEAVGKPGTPSEKPGEMSRWQRGRWPSATGQEQSTTATRSLGGVGSAGCPGQRVSLIPPPRWAAPRAGPVAPGAEAPERAEPPRSTQAVPSWAPLGSEALECVPDSPRHALKADLRKGCHRLAAHAAWSAGPLPGLPPLLGAPAIH